MPCLAAHLQHLYQVEFILTVIRIETISNVLVQECQWILLFQGCTVALSMYGTYYWTNKRSEFNMAQAVLTVVYRQALIWVRLTMTNKNIEHILDKIEILLLY